MEKDILDLMVSSFISEALNQAKTAFEGTNAEIKQFFNRGLKKYLDKQTQKYSFIKTLLKGNTPVYLYDIYYHLKLVSGQHTIETKNIKSIFDKSHYITIIGDAGSGKSTLIKHLFLNSIYEKNGIPILVELRYLNDYKNSFENYLYEKIFENKLSQNAHILDRLLKDGKFIFFLDGFDELSATIKSNLIVSLNSFINTYDLNKFILTTRPYSDVEHLPLFHNYYIKGLESSTGEIEGFIHKQLFSETELAAKIVNSINQNRNQHIGSFLKNPLLLSLYILTFQSDSSVPTQKYIFYRRVINALFTEHDSKTKLGFRREKASNLNQEQFEEVLKAFCFITFFEGVFVWNSDFASEKLRLIKSKHPAIQFENNSFIQDLKLAIALWVDDNGNLSFAHRSLQEYFAALAIKNLNPLQNQRIYAKIISRFSHIESNNEVENFLSLCDEMDVINFKKYYLIPLLKELKNMFSKEDEESIGKIFLTFLCTGLCIPINDPSEGKTIILNDKVIYRTIYIHFPFTSKLFSYLHKLIYEKQLKDCVFEKIKQKVKSNKNIEVNYMAFDKDNIPLDFWNIAKYEIISIGMDFYNYLIETIHEYEIFIENSEDLDRDLVDLI